MPAPLASPPVDDVTRRQFLGVLAAAGLLTSCGRAVVSEDGPATDPRTVAHAGGETTFDAVPERVVILDNAMLGDVLAFGALPVGTAAGIGEPTVIGTWRREAGVSDIPLVAPDFTPDLEAVAGVRPDAILAMAWQVEEPYWEGLRTLAPTVAVETDVDPGALDVRFDETAMRTYAEIFRRPEVVDDLVVEYERRIAALRTEFADVVEGRTVSFATMYDDGSMRADVGTGWAGAILADLGFAFPGVQEANLDPGFPVRVEFSAEEAVRFLGDSDVILWRVQDAGDEPAPGLPPAAVATNPLLARLPAVQAGQVFSVSEQAWFLRSVQGRFVVLDQLESAVLPGLRG
jgi:iron complex transport system substrate-binding protein